MSYNVLAPSLTAGGYLRGVHIPHLRWSYRRHNLAREWLYYSPDVLCLQVSPGPRPAPSPRHSSIACAGRRRSTTAFSTSCGARWSRGATAGASPSAARQTRCLPRRLARPPSSPATDPGSPAVPLQRDGCLVAWRTATLLEVESVAVTMNAPGHPLLCRPNVALAVTLQLAASRAPAHRLVVSCCHLLYNPRRCDVKLAQATTALRLLEAARQRAVSGRPLALRTVPSPPDPASADHGPAPPAAPASPPAALPAPVPHVLHGDPTAPISAAPACTVVFAGDFNSTPDSVVYELLRCGRVRSLGADVRTASGQLKPARAPAPGHGGNGSFVASLPPDRERSAPIGGDGGGGGGGAEREGEGGGAWADMLRAAQHSIPLCSAFASKSEGDSAAEPAFTTYCGAKVRCAHVCTALHGQGSHGGRLQTTVDYIWYSHDSATVAERVEPPPRDSLSPAIPNMFWSSDHVSLVAVLELQGTRGGAAAKRRGGSRSTTLAASRRGGKRRRPARRPPPSK